jgi:hypothetical protein
MVFSPKKLDDGLVVPWHPQAAVGLLQVPATFLMLSFFLCHPFSVFRLAAYDLCPEQDDRVPSQRRPGHLSSSG